VNVQLINARNDSHLWAEEFNRKLTNIFAVESEIVSRIADSLQAKLTGAEQRPSLSVSCSAAAKTPLSKCSGPYRGIRFRPASM
jgi:hypothetical protein